MTLYVGSGAALWSGYPVRFGAPSEIGLFRLTKRLSP
jgi:predicted MPP superfamily phosphohydrolase